MSLSIFQGLRFRPLDTPVHRLDPRVKLLISSYILAVALVYNEPYRAILVTSLSLIVLNLALLKVAKIARALLYTLRGAAPLAVIVFGLQLYASFGESLGDALYSASSLTVRFLAFISAFSLFFLTTSPDELALTLTFLRVPYSYTFAFVAAVRFAPLIAEEVQVIVDAQRSRGVEFERGNVFTRIRRLVSLFVPLLVNALRRSYEMAEAMEVKCFGATKNRTSFRTLSARRVDYAVAMLATLAFVIALYFRFSGLPLALP